MERLISKEELIQEIKRLLIEENISGAIGLCTQALKTQPLNAEIFTQRGMLYTIVGDAAKAYADIQQAKKLSNKTKVSEVILEMTRRMLPAKENENNAVILERFYQDARSSLEKNPPDLVNAYVNLSEIIRRDKKALLAYVKRAEVLYIMNNYVESADDCRSAIALDEDNLGAFIILAKAHFSSHNYIQAGAASEVVLLLDNKNIEGYYIWAMACYELKQYQRAIEICTQYFAINPNSSIFYCTRACCYFALGQLQHGEEDYQKAISLNIVLQETYLTRIKEAKMMYRCNALIFADQEPKTNLVQRDIALLDERAESFKKYAMALETLIKDQKETEAEQILSQYCLAELYAKCRHTYLHKFKSVNKLSEKNAYRIQKAACHYIIALDKLINGTMYNQQLFSCIIKRAMLNNAKLDGNTIPNNLYHTDNHFSNPISPDEILSIKSKLYLELILSISHLYVESQLSRQCFLALKSDYKERLTSCLNRAISIIFERHEDTMLLFEHLAKNTNNIFDLFNVKIMQVIQADSNKKQMSFQKF